MELVLKWIQKWISLKYLWALLYFLLVYSILSLVSSLYDTTQDGATIDTSDAHLQELIEIYRKELELAHSNNNTRSSQNKNNPKQKASLHKSNTGETDLNNLKNDTKLLKRVADGSVVTDYFDPDVAAIFNNDIKSDTEKHPTKQATKAVRKDNDPSPHGPKSLDYDYSNGDVVINAGALLDYGDQISNRTKVKPKRTVPYKSWEGAFYVEPYLLRGDVGEVDFECMYLRVRPSTPICLYESEKDVYISAFLRYNGLWEGHIVDQIQNALITDPSLGLIDLGSNLGQYSLIAAKMGRKVFAVEPYSQTLRRFKKACQIGEGLIPLIRVLKNAVTDQRTDMYIHLNPDNMGDARVDTNNSTCAGKCETVRSILLSDIVPYLHFDKAVLKIDIQGYESVMFYYADHLFDKVHIPFIFMEWVLLRDAYVHADHQSPEKRDVEFTIMYLTARGYSAYSSITGKPLNLQFWGGWPEDVYWVLQNANNEEIFNAQVVEKHKKIITE